MMIFLHDVCVNVDNFKELISKYPLNILLDLEERIINFQSNYDRPSHSKQKIQSSRF